MRQKHPDHSLKQMLAHRCLLALAACIVLLLSSPAQAAAPEPTRTTLVAAPGRQGAGATLTATVQTATGTPVGSGTVDFVLPNGQSLGSAMVQADGTAKLTTGALPTGVGGSPTLEMMAVYNAPAAVADTSGGLQSDLQGGYTGSRSAVTAIAAPAATTVAPDFTVTGNPTTVTVAQGSYGASAITVTSAGGYTGAIEFSCSGLPAQVTCAFNPTQQTLAANGSFTSALELQTQAAEGQQAALLPSHTGLALALAVPGALALFGLAGSYRRGLRDIRMLGLTLLIAGMGLGLSGCSQRYGYLHHPPPVAGGTPPGTYTVTVAVTGSLGSSAIEHDIPVSLVVQ